MWSTVCALKMERATSQSVGQSAAWESQGNSISQELPGGPGLCQDLDFSSGGPILDLDFESSTTINVCCLKPLRCALIFCSTKGKLMIYFVWNKVTTYRKIHSYVPLWVSAVTFCKYFQQSGSQMLHQAAPAPSCCPFQAGSSPLEWMFSKDFKRDPVL